MKQTIELPPFQSSFSFLLLFSSSSWVTIKFHSLSINSTSQRDFPGSNIYPTTPQSITSPLDPPRHRLDWRASFGTSMPEAGPPGATLMWFGKHQGTRFDRLEEEYRRALLKKYAADPSSTHLLHLSQPSSLFEQC